MRKKEKEKKKRKEMNWPIRIDEVHFFTTVCGLSLTIPLFPFTLFPPSCPRPLSPHTRNSIHTGAFFADSCSKNGTVLYRTHKTIRFGSPPLSSSSSVCLTLLSLFSSLFSSFLPLFPPLSSFFSPLSPLSILTSPRPTPTPSLLHSLLILLLLGPPISVPSLRLSASFSTLTTYPHSSLFLSGLGSISLSLSSDRISFSPLSYKHKQTGCFRSATSTDPPPAGRRDFLLRYFYPIHFLRLAFLSLLAPTLHNNDTSN